MGSKIKIENLIPYNTKMYSKEIFSVVSAIFVSGALAEPMNMPCDDPLFQCKLYTSDDFTGDYWHACLGRNWRGDRLINQGHSFIVDHPDDAEASNNQFMNA